MKTHAEPTKIKTVDLFCGVGGLTYGLQQAGIPVVAGYDLDEDCRYPYEHNNDVPFVKADVSTVKADEIATLLAGCDFSVIAGCAPCQPFSTYARTRPRDDARWLLLSSFARLVGEVQPDVVTMENVPQVIHHPIFAMFLRDLKRFGYQVAHGVLDCSRFGVPQTRRRLVVLASRHGLPRLPVPSDKRRTVREAIGTLPALAAGQRDTKDRLHRACALSAINLERIQSSEPGNTWRSWNANLRAACHQRDSGETYPSVYGRMEWDLPAPTITTQYFGFGNGRFGHPEQDRAISLREGAILQTFPRRYAFERGPQHLPSNRLGRLVGNAVPPMLAKAIGKAIRNHLDTCTQEMTAKNINLGLRKKRAVVDV